MTHRKHLKNKKKIVVKVGTSLLAYDNGKINLQRMEKLVRVLADLRNSGKEVILVTGGCRSGKSRFALDYVNNHFKNKVFVATAEALDNEMKRRIQRHQEERGPDWKTIEEPITLSEMLASLGMP